MIFSLYFSILIFSCQAVSFTEKQMIEFFDLKNYPSLSPGVVKLRTSKKVIILSVSPNLTSIVELIMQEEDICKTAFKHPKEKNDGTIIALNDKNAISNELFLKENTISKSEALALCKLLEQITLDFEYFLINNEYYIKGKLVGGYIYARWGIQGLRTICTHDFFNEINQEYISCLWEDISV